MKREMIDLTPREDDAFNRLRPVPGDAFDFWRKVTADRGLDPVTVTSFSGSEKDVSALPLGHGKHWCWPSALHMKRKVPA